MKKIINWYVCLVICSCLTIAAPGFAADCMTLKKSLKAERNFKKKREILSSAIIQCPDDPIINYKYGLSLERFKKYEKALGHYQKAASVEPKMAKAYAGMGDVYIYLGLLDDAVEAYQHAVNLRPDNDRHRNRLERLVIKRKALLGKAVTAGGFIKVMSHRGKISNNMSLLLIGPALQYQIAFSGDTDSLEPLGQRQIEAIGQAMRNDALKDIRFEVSVHADSELSSKAALEISRKRAMVLQEKFIADFQIDPKRIEVSWYGDAHPLGTGNVADGFVANQRVEFKRIIE